MTCLGRDSNLAPPRRRADAQRVKPRLQVTNLTVTSRQINLKKCRILFLAFYTSFLKITIFMQI